MYSLRYGTVPIVRRTGGLGDSVQHFDAVTGAGTGIVFFQRLQRAGRELGDRHARSTYTSAKGRWRRLVQNGMAQDFSWKRQVQRYIEAYEQLTG